MNKRKRIHSGSTISHKRSATLPSGPVSHNSCDEAIATLWQEALTFINPSPPASWRSVIVNLFSVEPQPLPFVSCGVFCLEDWAKFHPFIFYQVLHAHDPMLAEHFVMQQYMTIDNPCRTVPVKRDMRKLMNTLWTDATRESLLVEVKQRWRKQVEDIKRNRFQLNRSLFLLAFYLQSKLNLDLPMLRIRHESKETWHNVLRVDVQVHPTIKKPDTTGECIARAVVFHLSLPEQNRTHLRLRLLNENTCVLRNGNTHELMRRWPVDYVSKVLDEYYAIRKRVSELVSALLVEDLVGVCCEYMSRPSF